MYRITKQLFLLNISQYTILINEGQLIINKVEFK